MKKFKIKQTGVVVKEGTDGCYYPLEYAYPVPWTTAQLSQLGLTLEPYEEPVKRLLAYEDRSQMMMPAQIIFFQQEVNSTLYKRREDLDITYPKENV